jgi:hypothetical protein
MKLELKHLAPYLPYGLQVMDCEHNVNSIELVVGLHNDEFITHIDNLEFKSGKPILRPLSDLTKEMEFDNEKFTPSKDKYWGMNSFQYHINQFENWESPSAYLNSRAPYGLLLVLIKWHFDVFGLIEAGLAIDINTL